MESFTEFLKLPTDEDVNLRALKYIFKVLDIRKIIESKDFYALETHPNLIISYFKVISGKLMGKYRNGSTMGFYSNAAKAEHYAH